MNDPIEIAREIVKSWHRGYPPTAAQGHDLLIGFEALEQDRDKWRNLETEAATYIESLICMRTAFKGRPPYVGWKGLGLWLEKEFDKRDAALAVVEAARLIPPELQIMYDGIDRERRIKGSYGSLHRDRFESHVDGLEEELGAYDALTASEKSRAATAGEEAR